MQIASVETIPLKHDHGTGNSLGGNYRIESDEDALERLRID